MKDGPRRLILCPQHKQAHLPCRWFVEVELPPGQARTALRRHCPYTPSQCQATPAAGPPNWQHRVFYSRFTHSPTHQGRGPSELEVSTGAPHTHVQYMHKHTHHKHTYLHTHSYWVSSEDPGWNTLWFICFRSDFFIVPGEYLYYYRNPREGKNLSCWFLWLVSMFGFI